MSMHAFMKVVGEKPVQSEKKPINGVRQLESMWSWRPDMEPRKMRARPFSGKAIVMLCVACFMVGSLISNHSWNTQLGLPVIDKHEEKIVAVTEDNDNERRLAEGSPRDIMEEVSKAHQAIQSLDKTVSSLEMELAVARTSGKDGPPLVKPSTQSPQKAFIVIGINTAFSSKKRRESLRQTWVPTGAKLKKLEKEKGIVIRFVIGHSVTPGGVLDRSIEEEDAKTGDFLRLDHVEGYHELSSKTRLYFSTAVSMWDADFYVKVDDDVHVNLGMLASALARHGSKPRTYVGCMKSGPVLSQKPLEPVLRNISVLQLQGVKYHEPEHWKFGEEGNKYFRHATGQIYAISKDLAAYISVNAPILHRYANEDVSLGSWFIGLEVQHIDDRSMCCGTPPDCEWKRQAGNACVASFDWSCSGICKSVERMMLVHNKCGEGEGAVWNVAL